MPTIAEIIAAKKAAAAGSQTIKPAAAPPRQPTAADLEVEAAINRIDPPGKRRAGLVVSNKTPLQPAVIAEKITHKENRSLSQTSAEAIPMVPVNADPEEQTWHSALNAFETELCLMRDPQDSEVAWLAVRSYRAGMPPILLHRLPWILWDQPHNPTDREPF
jgi:phosphatidate phosphatase APP1